MLPARRMIRMLAVAVMVLAYDTAHAQNFPNKPIRLVTVGVGGAMDFMSRLLATGLSASFGQPVIVDNRSSGFIPGQIVSKEPLIKSHVDCVAGKMWMDVRRATTVVARTTKPRSAATQTPHFAATRMGRRFAGDLLIYVTERSVCLGGSTIVCTSLRASHPAKRPSPPRGI